MIALFAGPLQSTYTASKWAVRGFSQALRLELAEASIGVTCVMPGTIATPFLSAARTYDDRGTERLAVLMTRYGTSPERVGAILPNWGNDRSWLRIQPIDATHWLNCSAGVWKSNVSRGLSLSRRATALSLF